MREVFSINTFETLQNNTKWLCEIAAKPLIEMLKNKKPL